MYKYRHLHHAYFFSVIDLFSSILSLIFDWHILVEHHWLSLQSPRSCGISCGLRLRAHSPRRRPWLFLHLPTGKTIITLKYLCKNQRSNALPSPKNVSAGYLYRTYCLLALQILALGPRPLWNPSGIRSYSFKSQLPRLAQCAGLLCQSRRVW